MRARCSKIVAVIGDEGPASARARAYAYRKSREAAQCNERKDVDAVRATRSDIAILVRDETARSFARERSSAVTRRLLIN